MSEPASCIDPRVVLAAERTLLAWIRTGLAAMGFGFVVARFGFFLRELAETTGHHVQTKLNASAVGVALVGAGVLVNVWASFRHRRMVSRLETTGQLVDASGSALVVGVTTSIAGAVLVVVLLRALLE